ncbi:MFS transporter [Reyranella sp. CPCC 100927]|uniref:MFS transporter n=1 Tax=Reyranella sp. CPCC 100927 TaxID=2599616 RepID=UPI0011B5A390|nr:MFS transporter [Reyranella sp. CPCC 100927]TWT12802.1 MFS transporter [Reyranella sp. CPCC 100927]
MKDRAFYGWWVVASTFAVLCVGFGVAYCFAAFFLPLQSEFGARRGDISLVFAVAGGLYFSLGLPSGALADRIGPRWVVAGGMALVALGAFAASQATTLWHVYIGYGTGVGVGIGLAYVPAIAAVQRWFLRRRGLATGIAVSGIGVGTILAPPLAQAMIDHWGWRNAYVGLGLITLACALFAAFTMLRSPELYGQHPDGDATSATAANGTGESLAEAARTLPFWLLFIACAANAFGLFIPFVHLVPYVRDAGLSEAYGVTLITLLGIGSAVGRFAFAGLAHRIGRQRGYAAMFLGTGAAQLLWASTTDVWLLAIFATAFGAFYGGFVAMAPSVIADYFGTRAVGAILGAQYASVSVGALLGPTAAGFMFDLSGSYVATILGGAVLAFLGAVCILAAPSPATWRTRSTS